MRLSQLQKEFVIVVFSFELHDQKYRININMLILYFKMFLLRLKFVLLFQFQRSIV
jgi:hypothetical protein